MRGFVRRAAPCGVMAPLGLVNEQVLEPYQAENS